MTSINETTPTRLRYRLCIESNLHPLLYEKLTLISEKKRTISILYLADSAAAPHMDPASLLVNDILSVNSQSQGKAITISVDINVRKGEFPNLLSLLISSNKNVRPDLLLSLANLALRQHGTKSIVCGDAQIAPPSQSPLPVKIPSIELPQDCPGEVAEARQAPNLKSNIRKALFASTDDLK